MPKLVYLLVLVGLLASCSAPVKSPPFAYREDKAISSSQGVPHDSATSYFPADASVNASKDSLIQRLGDCQSGFRSASKSLFAFKAPVLSNYYLGHTIYRLLWARALQPPVLLTVDLTAAGGVLKTQLLNRFPEPMTSAAEVEAKSRPEIRRIQELELLIRAGQDVANNKGRIASAKDRLFFIKLDGSPLIIKNEKAVALSRNQIQQFQKLLTQADFWQLPSCEPSACFDGATYVLEAHEANRYQVVKRQCFIKESSGIGQCYKFLLDLSPAKPEPRQP